MNTLPKEITRSYFKSDEGYLALERHWSSLVNSEARSTLGPEHYLLYQALRGKDWRKAFTPITNQKKLANGAFYDWGLQHALRRIHSHWAQEELLKPFAGLIDAGIFEVDAFKKLSAMLPRSIAGFEVAEAYEVSVHA
jgi:hypothetical protein